MSSRSVALIALTRGGARLARRLAGGIDATLYILRRYGGDAGKGAHLFDDLSTIFPIIFREHSRILFIGAAGIAVRMAAPLLQSKERDPALVVMDEKGEFAIPILSGHLGGGNDLARTLAHITGGRPVITTATDVNQLPSFDLVAQEMGWEIERLDRVKHANAALLDGEPIAVVDQTGRLRHRFAGRGELRFHDTLVTALRSSCRVVVLVSNAVVPPAMEGERLLVLRPRNLFLGVGCNRGTAAEEILSLVTANLKRLFLSPRSIGAIATAEAKRGEGGLREAAEELKVPLLFFSSDELNGVPVPSPPSPHAQRAIGVRGVAEPAALLASRGGELILSKVRSGNVTLAIAEDRP
ncbi:MAG: cobalt-precorrin 5A hydrolase [Desulfuromonadia bacterium]